jgi:phosphohistidine swiveling domain-containing protein
MRRVPAMTATTPATGTVLPLATATDHRIAGRKAATLARLATAGFRVPPGVVVPTAIFESATGEREVPAEVAADLLSAVHGWGEVPLAVRSSGVGEDSADASYAGLLTTVLNVRGDTALLDAVRECWNSASDARVTSYAGLEPPRLAVLVQPMVEATAAGVAFTADPVTGERGCIVIDSITGIGDRLVSGAVTPHRWVIRGDDAHQHSAEEQAIDTAQARSIADLARRVEAELGGGPQDIEWALVKDELILLQARPITALPIQPVPIPIAVPPGYWEREASHLPLPLSPFSERAIIEGLNRAVRRTCAELGLLLDAVQARNIGGWFYVGVVPLGGKEPPRLPGWLVPVTFKLVPPLRRRIRDSVEAMRADVAGALLQRWSREWRPDFVARVRAHRERQLPTLSDTDLDAHLADVMKLVDDGHDVHFRLHGALAMVLGDLAFTCRDLLDWDETHIFSLLGGTSTTSTEPARALADLAALAGPQVGALLKQAAPANKVLAADERFASAFAAYLRDYGCRTSEELADPSLEERPDRLLALLRDQLDSGLDSMGQQELTRRRDAAADEARASLDGADLARFDRAFTRAMKAYPVREDNMFLTGNAPYGLLRRTALELGRRLASRGQITEVDDIFFLHPDEARARLADGTGAHQVVMRRKGERAWALANPGPSSYGPDPGPPPPMRGLPEEAKLANEAFQWYFDRILAADSRGAADDRTITGIPASAGRYTGTVRVIHSEAEFDRLRPGEVLVCPVTSPVWSVLFPRVGALVTDSGGVLSHPAIIAREFRVPAVVATRFGTAQLRDGQVVTVDGTTGTVELLR